MESADFLLTVPILEKLISLVNNPYWLVKVKLVELLSNIPYQTIYFVTGSCSYQSNILDSIVLKFLGNEDSRLRKYLNIFFFYYDLFIIFLYIFRLIQNLYFPSDYVKSNVLFARCSKIQVNMFAKIIDNQTGQSPENHCDIIENTLCRIVTLLTEALLVSSSKHLTFGCIEALSLLSEEYPAKEYPLGWHFNISTNESESVSWNLTNSNLVSNFIFSSGIFPYIVTMLTSSSTAIDLESHQWLLKLAGNLYFG
uniref:Uncharacterized protein n=1 Tax=Rhodnius prolixus TaxID=13249 RepID=T1IAD0_RHOPR